jgi:hypothetical protein
MEVLQHLGMPVVVDASEASACGRWRMTLWQTLLDPFGYSSSSRAWAPPSRRGALRLSGVRGPARHELHRPRPVARDLRRLRRRPLLGVPILLGAGLWGLASALAINAVARSRRIGADAAIGVVTHRLLRPRASRCSTGSAPRGGLDALLFGSINGVSEGDLLLLTGALTCAVLVFTVGYRAFLFSSFDPEVAGVSGVRVKRMDALLMVVLSLSILATPADHRRDARWPPPS